MAQVKRPKPEKAPATSKIKIKTPNLDKLHKKK